MFILFPRHVKVLENIAIQDINFRTVLWNQIKYQRLKSLFSLPTEFSFFILSIFPLFLYFLYKKKVNKFISGFLIIFVLITLVLSKSFGTIFGFGAIIITIFVFFPLDKKIKEIISVSLFFIVLSIGTLISFFRGQDLLNLTPLKLRTYHWMVAVKEFLSSPFYGVGLGNFGPYSSFYSLSSEPHSKFVHNFVLQALAELGVIGIIILVILTLFFIKLLRKTEKSYLNIVLISSVLVIIFYNLIDIGIYFQSIGILFAFFIGFLLKNSNLSKRRIRKKEQVVIVIILLLMLPIFYSDYYSQDAKFMWKIDKEKSFFMAKKSLKFFSQNPVARSVVISYYIDKNRIGDAEKALKRLEKIDPISLITYKLKVAVALKKKDYYDLLSVLEFAEKRYKNNDYFKSLKSKILKNE